MELKGKVVIFTGATGGIGRPTVLDFVREGVEVVALVAREKNKLEDLAREIRGLGGKTLILPTDVTKESEVQAMAENVWRECGRIDILVNGAGMWFQQADYTLKQLRDLFELNVFAPVSCIYAVLPYMKKQGQGVVINIGSTLGRTIIMDVWDKIFYPSSKSALTAISFRMREYLKKSGSKIKICLISPGSIPATSFYRDRSEVEMIRRMAISTPEEVAKQIVRLVKTEKKEIIGPPKMMIPTVKVLNILQG